MPAIQKSLRIPEGTLAEIEKITKETGKDFSTVTKDLLAEAIKMRRCPGILFVEGVNGRRARVAGTGIEVWEIIATFKSVAQEFERLRSAYHWLKEQQLRAALAYYTSYREEIDEQIRRNESWTRDELSSRHPYLDGSAM
ncbi:MAG: hypothetical protein DRG82_09095 [Deltaproteobacteria bacterium]|nr:MAG: hypothetical protein DRG82_09095 [Deltaproteobacteria bacterium]